MSRFAQKALAGLSLSLALLCCVSPWLGMFAMHIGLLLSIWASSLLFCVVCCWDYRKLAVLGIPLILSSFWLFAYGCALSGGPCP